MSEKRDDVVRALDGLYRMTMGDADAEQIWDGLNVIRLALDRCGHTVRAHYELVDEAGGAFPGRRAAYQPVVKV